MQIINSGLKPFAVSEHVSYWELFIINDTVRAGIISKEKLMFANFALKEQVTSFSQEIKKLNCVKVFLLRKLVAFSRSTFAEVFSNSYP